MRYLIIFLPSLLVLSACSSKPQSTETNGESPFVESLLQKNSGEVIYSLMGDFAFNPATEQFIDKMVKQHGFDRQELHNIFAETKRLDSVLNLMERQAPSTTKPPASVRPKPNGAWIRYSQKFIQPDNIQNGVVFWNQYNNALQRAWKTYGVQPEIIVGIIGVETRWGKIMGRTRILDALATLSFEYPRRAEYFTGELETFLLMTRDEGKDPLSLRGSFAGAMGYGQFMPSSFKNYAVDFNGDGHINLWDPVDAIGSIANYFKSHGWEKDATIVVPAIGQVSDELKHGFNTRYSITALASAGLKPQHSLSYHNEASLLRLDMGSDYQYWYGLPNFYTITRYNHSTHYAMAVWMLGQSVGEARKRQ